MSSRRNGTLPPRATGLLKEQAYASIKQRILTGVFGPGTFLAERHLAGDLGMSKTPVKAALERLEHEGFITVSPQQGIVVRSMSISEIADQYEIRSVLESYTVRTLAGRLAPEHVRRLRENLAAQQKWRPKDGVKLTATLDAEYHRLYSEFLGNQEINRVMNQLHEKMSLVISTVFQTHPTRAESSYQEHVELAEAVITGDGVRASKLIVDHLEYGKRLILSRREV